jgi:hypothetical protein
MAGGSPWTGPPQAPRPGVVPLRPLGLGEILDASITYIRRNPRASLGLAAGVAVVNGLLQLVVLLLSVGQLPSLEESAFDASGGSETSGTLVVNLASIVQGVLSVFLVLIATGMLTFVMSQSVLGRPVTARTAWDRVKPQVWRLLGLTLLTFVLVAGALLLLLLPGIAFLVAGAGPLGVFALVVGGIVGVVAAVWIYVVLVLAPPALVLERTTVAGALRRSRTLVRGSFWRILGITLLAAILANVISSIVTIPFALLGVGAGVVLGDGADGGFAGALFGATLGSAAGLVITLPFSAGVTSLLYIDRRMRREGLDLELQRAADQNPAGYGPQPGVPSTRLSGPQAPLDQQW